MTKMRVLLLLLASIGVGAGLMNWYDKKHEPVPPPCKADVLVMRTNGGMLEVATVRKDETFTKRWVYTVAGVVVGRTTTEIRVPAHYTYRIRLAPEWRVLRTGKVFTVITPPLEPKEPVAVDFSKMEKFDGGNWVLATFNNAANLANLEKSLTTELARRAHAPSYIDLQRSAARKTVEEFVRKWLLTQTQWSTEQGSQVHVLFADEPIGSVETLYGPNRKPNAERKNQP